MNRGELARLLTVPRYPRSLRYDPVWLVDNMMGPCAAWLTEALTDVMRLAKGEHVLDLGCGKAISSVFLAREFGVQVEAVDLWIDPDENERRIAEAGVSDLVTAHRGDAIALDFPDGSFDAIVSVDAYHYFGTRPGVLADLARLLRPGGSIGIVVPGLRHDVPWPEHLAPWWQEGFESFHSPRWWARLWEKETVVRVDRADMVHGGAEDWLTWTEASDAWASATGKEPYRLEAEMLRADRDRLLGFARIVAMKLAHSSTVRATRATGDESHRRSSE